MHRTIRFVTTSLCLLLCLATAQAEDLTIVSRVTPPKGSPTTSTQYISADAVRTSDGASDTIVHIASGRIIAIEHKKKKYYETTFEEIRAHFSELEEMLEANPMMGNLFGGAKGVRVEKGSGNKEIAGYSCQQYNLSFGPNFSFEVWATPEIQPPLEYYDASKLFYANIGPFAGRFEKMFDEMKKIDGMALATTVDANIIGFNLKSASEATEVRKGPIPADVFEPPAGYKKKKSPYRQK